MTPCYVRGEVYWANLQGFSRSSVQKGSRPVVIISSLAGILSSDLVMVAPLTTKIKPLAINADIRFKIDDRDQQVLGNQVTTLPKFALHSKVGQLDEEDMRKVETSLLIALGITPSVLAETKTTQEAALQAKKDREALSNLIPQAKDLVRQLNEILDRQGKVKVETAQTQRKYRRRSQEEIDEFMTDWEDPACNREKLVTYYKFSSYGAAYNFWWTHKKKREANEESE